MSNAVQTKTAGKLRKNLGKVLLICGILTGLVYVVTDILAASLYPGYNFANQAVSELFAIGAPTSSLVIPLFTLSSMLLAVFGFGIWVSSTKAFVDGGSHNRAMRIMALMAVANAINTLVLWNFFPMHMRGAQATFTDTMHYILAINPFVLLTVVLAVVAFRNWFRFYSIAAILMQLVPAILAFSNAPLLFAHQPTPWLGIEERFSQYANQVWLGVLAIVLLLRKERNQVKLAEATPNEMSG